MAEGEDVTVTVAGCGVADGSVGEEEAGLTVDPCCPCLSGDEDEAGAADPDVCAPSFCPLVDDACAGVCVLVASALLMLVVAIGPGTPSTGSPNSMIPISAEQHSSPLQHHLPPPQ